MRLVADYSVESVDLLPAQVLVEEPLIFVQAIQSLLLKVGGER